MTDYISREAVNALIEAECSPKVAAFLNQAIDTIPAADARTVVRGKWKVSVHKTYYDVSCSVCGINSFFQIDEKGFVSYANFCPNCGADMRAEPPKEET